MGLTESILPCRKCGSIDYNFWDGRGTQADLVCKKCGNEESMQVYDRFEYGDERKHSPLDPVTLMNRTDIIEAINVTLVKRWNERVVDIVDKRLAVLETERNNRRMEVSSVRWRGIIMRSIVRIVLKKNSV